MRKKDRYKSHFNRIVLTWVIWWLSCFHHLEICTKSEAEISAIVIFSFSMRINGSDHDYGAHKSPEIKIHGPAVFCKYLEIYDISTAQIWSYSRVWSSWDSQRFRSYCGVQELQKKKWAVMSIHHRPNATLSASDNFVCFNYAGNWGWAE